MSNLDGFELLDRLNEENIRAKKVVLSSLKNEGFIDKAISLGADYYMAKPVQTDVLIKRLKDLADKKSNVCNIKTSKTRHLDEKISNIFITVGIHANIKG